MLCWVIELLPCTLFHGEQGFYWLIRYPVHSLRQGHDTFLGHELKNQTVFQMVVIFKTTLLDEKTSHQY